MRSEHEVFTALLEWAEASENVRAILLNGSRGDPSRVPDRLSDYDVAVIVQDLEPIIDGDWLDRFGTIMVRWPLTPEQTLGPGWITQLVLFEDGVRIDFQFTTPGTRAVEQSAPFHCVLVDRDRVTESLQGIPVDGMTIRPPTPEQLEERINAFWWDIPYVAKALSRRELDYAKFSMDVDIRFNKLHPLIRWYIGMKHGPETDVGIHGRWFRRYLDESVWNAYVQTFSGVDWDDQWRAVFTACDLVRLIGCELAGRYEADYPAVTDVRVSRYLSTIQQV